MKIYIFGWFKFICIGIFSVAFVCETPAQTWKWANSIGTANSTTTTSSVKPYAGTSVLLTGSFAAPNLTLGSYSLSNAGQDDGWVAIANDLGHFQWATRIGGTGNDFVIDAAADNNGNFVVAGNFNSFSLTIGNNNLFSSGETDIFLVRYLQNKTIAWVIKIGTADIEEAKRLTMDPDGNIYLLGQVNDKLTNATLYAFLRKINPEGNLIWEQKITPQNDYVELGALTLSQNKGIYIGGLLAGKVNFGGNILVNDTSNAAFIVKYSFAGTVTHTWMNPSLDKINDLQAHPSGLYACAQKFPFCFGWGWPLNQSQIHIMKFNDDLQPLWYHATGGEDFCQSLDIAVSLSADELGNVYTTGYFFSDTLRFAGQVLPNLFNQNYFYPQIFVIKHSPDGEELWGKMAGGLHTDEATDIHVIAEDKFYLCGRFESDPAFFESLALHNTGNLDSVYVHLRPKRFSRKPMAFLAFYDKGVSNTGFELPDEQTTVFPNPASDYVILDLKSVAITPVTVEIYSADYRLYRQITYPEPLYEIKVDLADFQPGVYLVTLKSSKSKWIGKILKL